MSNRMPIGNLRLGAGGLSLSAHGPVRVRSHRDHARARGTHPTLAAPPCPPRALPARARPAQTRAESRRSGNAFFGDRRRRTPSRGARWTRQRDGTCHAAARGAGRDRRRGATSALSPQDDRARLLRRRRRRGGAGRSGRRPAANARRVRGGRHGVERVLVGRRRAAHAHARPGDPAGRRTGARAGADDPRRAGSLPETAGRWEEPVPHERGARRRAHHVARRPGGVPRSPHGRARDPVLAPTLTVAVRDRTSPEAATHYSGAILPRRRSIALLATTSVVAPFACATIRYDQRTRRPDAASRLWPGKCVALWEWCETACGSCGGGLIERRGG